jgi:hypothetical protein
MNLLFSVNLLGFPLLIDTIYMLQGLIFVGMCSNRNSDIFARLLSYLFISIHN